MIITIIILGYIASVFLCRWLDKIACRMDDTMKPTWIAWLIPVINTVYAFMLLLAIFVAVIFSYIFNCPKRFRGDIKFFKWFRGDHW